MRVADAVLGRQWLCLDGGRAKLGKRLLWLRRRHGLGNVLVAKSGESKRRGGEGRRILVELILWIISVTIAVLIDGWAHCIAEGRTHCQRARGWHLGGAGFDHYDLNGRDGLLGGGDDRQGGSRRRSGRLPPLRRRGRGCSSDAGTADPLASMPLVLDVVGAPAGKLGRYFRPPVDSALATLK